MTFRSILGDQPSADASAEAAQAPVYFVDFNLDQIVTAITAGKGEYNLKPFFYRPLKDSDAIAYRHEVLRDLENAALLGCVNAFADKMKSMREHLIQSGKMHYRYQKEAWFLDAVDIYCDAVGDLVAGLKASEARSRGFLSLRQYLIGYVDSPAFQTLSEDTRGLKHQLNAIRYSLVIKDGVVTVSNWRSEIDYGAAIQADFEKFKQGAASDHRFKFADFAQMNHIEAGILDRVARLYPETFLALDSYFLRNGDYQDRAVRIFDREVQFYVSYIEYMDPFKQSGLSFCYPVVSRENKAIAVSEGFDPALARKLLGEKSLVVCNDFQLRGKERVIIVSGPNQGGKTTFARMFGQLHHLASIGCPVPGASARLFLFDELFAHFERQEDIHNLRGKLQDDLIRIHETLSHATTNSIVIMNEIFNSTSLRDAIFLSTKVLDKIIELDLICLCVTFINELTDLSDTTVSMVSNVKPGNVAERTYKIVRRPSDGLAYAVSIAEKYRLTCAQLRERLPS